MAGLWTGLWTEFWTEALDVNYLIPSKWLKCPLQRHLRPSDNRDQCCKVQDPCWYVHFWPRHTHTSTEGLWLRPKTFAHEHWYISCKHTTANIIGHGLSVSSFAAQFSLDSPLAQRNQAIISDILRNICTIWTEFLTDVVQQLFPTLNQLSIS